MVSRTSNQRCFCERRGFTLVELLVTMAILLLLLALLLPAIQSVREAGRRAHCQNSLKQIATALFIYHDSHGTFPQGGWGHEWVGVPERGSGQRQPGGWIYRLLPHIEESALHDLGLGADGNDASDLYSKRLGTPISLFVCPSRRACATWQIADQYPYVRLPKPYGAVLTVARADYAINAGASYIFSFRGPADLVQGDDPQFWKKLRPTPRTLREFPICG